MIVNSIQRFRILTSSLSISYINSHPFVQAIKAAAEIAFDPFQRAFNCLQNSLNGIHAILDLTGIISLSSLVYKISRYVIMNIFLGSNQNCLIIHQPNASTIFINSSICWLFFRIVDRYKFTLHEKSLLKLLRTINSNEKVLTDHQKEICQESILYLLNRPQFGNRLIRHFDKDLDIYLASLLQLISAIHFKNIPQSLIAQLLSKKSDQKLNVKETLTLFQFQKISRFLDLTQKYSTLFLNQNSPLNCLKQLLNISDRLLPKISFQNIPDGTIVILDLNRNSLFENDYLIKGIKSLLIRYILGHTGIKYDDFNYIHLVKRSGVCKDYLHERFLFFGRFFKLDFGQLLTVKGQQILEASEPGLKIKNKKIRRKSCILKVEKMYRNLFNDYVQLNKYGNIELSFLKWPQSLYGKQRKTPGNPDLIGTKRQINNMTCSAWVAKTIVLCIYELNKLMHLLQEQHHQKNPDCCSLNKKLINFGYVRSPINPFFELGKVSPIDLATKFPAIIELKMI